MTEVTRGFCWHKNFVPWDCLPLPCGHIHLLNHEKMYIKSEVEEILLKLATNDHSDKPSCWHQNFGPNGLSAPAQGLCLIYVSSITADLNLSSALRKAIQDQWSSGLKSCIILKTWNSICCLNFIVFHEKSTIDPFLWTIRWKVMDAKHFSRVFRASKLLEHKQMKIILKSRLGHLFCLKIW